MSAETRNRTMGGLLVVIALTIGLGIGFATNPPDVQAAPTSCCLNCNEYCKCDNREIEGTCYTVACEAAGNCTGVGIKCCFLEEA